MDWSFRLRLVGFFCLLGPLLGTLAAMVAIMTSGGEALLLPFAILATPTIFLVVLFGYLFGLAPAAFVGVFAAASASSDGCVPIWSVAAAVPAINAGLALSAHTPWNMAPGALDGHVFVLWVDAVAAFGCRWLWNRRVALRRSNVGAH